jgi:hypothetical protein
MALSDELVCTSPLNRRVDDYESDIRTRIGKFIFKRLTILGGN